MTDEVRQAAERPDVLEDTFRFVCEWYREEEIRRCVAIEWRQSRDAGNLPKIPLDVRSQEFADWLCTQYRLAMMKGIDLAKEAMQKRAAEHDAYLSTVAADELLSKLLGSIERNLAASKRLDNGSDWYRGYIAATQDAMRMAQDAVDAAKQKQLGITLKPSGQSPAPRISPDYVIEIEAVNGPCYVDDEVDGDPGRTCRIESATRYATRNEANENMYAIQNKYPNRKYSIKPIEEKPSGQEEGK